MSGEPYLVIKNGPLAGRQFRLQPGQITTIGRAPTNRIAIPDEICSRNHCEIFQSGGRWIVRDLASRNGTRVQGQLIEADHPLQFGQVIQLGSTLLWFTDDPHASPKEPTPRDPLEAETATTNEVTLSLQQPEILHRTRQTRYHTAEAHSRDRMSRDLARLYRLAMDMGLANNLQELSDKVLEGLLSAMPADIGAVLLLPRNNSGPPTPQQLQVVVYKSRRATSYQRVSDSLSQLALLERDAILARDVHVDSRLAQQDSVHEISAQSVICAPLRAGENLLGLIHLYSTNSNHPLEPEDLDFTLAVADQFALALDHLQRQEQLADGLARVETENQTLREQLRVETELVGESSAIRRLREKIAKIAPTDATVLIRGESGVGKELVARAIHLNSPRRHGPFITMNCAALSESLLESELFGHEKGSFTGAVSRKLGKFEQAHGGTLFLDEVGEMSPAIQAKFLRVLEGHPFERVGGGAQVHVDVRVVAATNRELERAVESAGFRKDLYFRLQVVEIFVEPLRDRREDVPILARHFLEKFARKIGRTVTDFSPAALELLKQYDWPGNVRELQNTIERAVILSTGPLIGVEDIQLSTLGRQQAATLDPRSPGPVYRPRSLEEVEQEHILATLAATQGNKSHAAQILGIERSTLDRKLKRYESGQQGLAR